MYVRHLHSVCVCSPHQPFYFSFLFIFDLIFRFAEVNDYAKQIGINPKSEPHLLYLAKDGLLQAIPSEWQIW